MAIYGFVNVHNGTSQPLWTNPSHTICLTENVSRWTHGTVYSPLSSLILAERLVYLVVEVVEGDPILGQQVVETLREVPDAQLVPAIRTTITNKIKHLQVSEFGITHKVTVSVRPMSRSFKVIRIISNSIATATISLIFITQSLKDTHLCKASVSITVSYH